MAGAVGVGAVGAVAVGDADGAAWRVVVGWTAGRKSWKRTEKKRTEKRWGAGEVVVVGGAV